MLRRILLVGTCFLLLCACQTGNEKLTTVFVVRHAEKVATDSTDDPPLTQQGKKRAASLWENLDIDTLHALYSTDYQRTRATLEPIAEKFNLPITLYEAHDFDGLAIEIMDKHAGQNVIVSGHSNTVLPIIQALGANPPIDSIGDQDYDNIFTVEISADGKARASVKPYQNFEE